MDRRTLIAILLIIVVFWLSNELIWKNKTATVTDQPVLTDSTTVEHETFEEESQQEEVITYFPETDSTIDINDDLILENEAVSIRLSNRGGLITAIFLRDYYLSDQTTPANLIPLNEKLMNIELKTTQGNIINFRNQVFEYHYYQENRQLEFIFNSGGKTIKKTYTLLDGYELDFSLQIESSEEFDGYDLDLDSGIADTEEYLKMKSREYKTIVQIDNDVVKYTLAKLKKKQEMSGRVRWASLRSKYFMIGVIPEDLVAVNGFQAYKKGDSPALKLGITSVYQTTLKHNYKLYAGPLIYENLKKYNIGIENSIEMGPKFLRWISKAFMVFLKFLYGIIGNWGISLIILAFILKIILHPLTHKSFESSHKMQKIQPMMKEIQAKYKNDPRTMNLELKKLYKEQGVSPLGGCLPLLLQMPILFALYPILRYSIDLRQTSFLWVPDLSEPDPTMILPIAMAVFMFVQQKLMAPSKKALEEMDEKQRAASQSQKMMMYIMPIMMFVIFRSLSSGLVLYWTVFSIASTIHQHFIRKRFNK